MYPELVYTHLVTLNVNGAWQPTDKETDKTAEFWCGQVSFRVEWVGSQDEVNYVHGAWSCLEAVHRFAVSMPSQIKPKAVACEPYMYAPAYGRVEGKSIRHALEGR